jgi:tetratricopeptide (TPR) repeat protein
MHMKLKAPFILLVFLVSTQAVSAQQIPKIDSVHMLLLNPHIEIAATEAINLMYNFKFDESMRKFKYLKYEYGWHPLPYFLMGLNYWWRIVPNMNNTAYDNTFRAYMDSTIMYAERLHKKTNPIEGAFFLAAAYGFKARLYSDREQYRKAIWDAQKSLKYLKESNQFTTYSPEILFGDGLMNYYGEWIRENYPLLKPLLFMFPKGDKELGLKQLTEVSRNAFYARTEAQFYLMGIMLHDEGNYQEATYISEYLHNTFPDNPYFHRFYAHVLFQRGQYKKVQPLAEQMMARIDSGMFGYEAYTGRYAAFFLAKIYRSQKDMEKAEHYYERSVKFSIQANATDKGYYHQSLLDLADIHEKRGDKIRAKVLYTEVKKLTKRKDGVNETARERLKKL